MKKGVIIIKLSDESATGKPAGAARKGLGEDRGKYHEKIQNKILKKHLTRSSESDIILKLLYGAEIAEKVFLKNLKKKLDKRL